MEFNHIQHNILRPQWNENFITFSTLSLSNGDGTWSHPTNYFRARMKKNNFITYSTLNSSICDRTNHIQQNIPGPGWKCTTSSLSHPNHPRKLACAILSLSKLLQAHFWLFFTHFFFYFALSLNLILIAFFL
jgi:hypothetical protein